MCFNKYQIYRYLCADGNVLNLQFIKGLDLCSLIALRLFRNFVMLERQEYIYIYIYILYILSRNLNGKLNNKRFDNP
jgi:hypothetical protein